MKKHRNKTNEKMLFIGLGCKEGLTEMVQNCVSRVRESDVWRPTFQAWPSYLVE